MAPGRTLWRCPKCGRRFSNRNQWHSCVSYSIEDHFRGKPTSLKEIFDLLLTKLKRYGPVRIDAVKSSINIAGKRHFAGVNVRKDSLNVGFLMNRELRDERIFRSQSLGGKRFGHVVKLGRIEDVDAQLMGWLKEAYSLSRPSRVL